MRIIDKNTDFYDYLQNIYPDNSLTFDRRDSFILTKKIMCDNLFIRDFDFEHNKDNFLLLQVCNTFWLFLAKITKWTNFKPLDYSIELLSTWKNYNKKYTLIQFDNITFDYSIKKFFYDKKKVDVLIQAVDNNDYHLRKSLCDYVSYREYKYSYIKTVKHIPLLKTCGVAQYIDPLEIYLSFEEYFSLEKTSSEQVEAYGTTNDDKITNHGFDIETSFRGKNKWR